MLSKYCVFSGRCYLTEAQKAKVLALVKKIRPEIPVLVVQMKKSNVEQSGTLVRKFYRCILYELLFFCTHVQFLFYLGKLVVLLQRICLHKMHLFRQLKPCIQMKYITKSALLLSKSVLLLPYQLKLCVLYDLTFLTVQMY